MKYENLYQVNLLRIECYQLDKITEAKTQNIKIKLEFTILYFSETLPVEQPQKMQCHLHSYRLCKAFHPQGQAGGRCQ